MPGPTHSRRRLLAALAALPLGACAGKSRREGGRTRPVGLTVARTPAAGRPATCPDDAVDPFGDGRPGPMDLRCSYADAAGGQAVQLTGHVRWAPRGVELGDGLSDVTVHVRAARPDGSPGEIVAEATTDAQGGFSVAALLPAGEYLLVIPAVVAGPPMATRRFELFGADRSVPNLDLLVVRPDAATP